MAQLETPCVEHTGPTRGGYGYVYVDGKSWRRHRYAYYTKYGPIPEGAVVRHLCHNKRCYNVEHLAIGSVMDNARDSVEADMLYNKLPYASVRAIRTEYQLQEVPNQSELARKWKVAASTINRIVRGARRAVEELSYD